MFLLLANKSIRYIQRSLAIGETDVQSGLCIIVKANNTACMHDPRSLILTVADMNIGFAQPALIFFPRPLCARVAFFLILIF